MTKKLTLLPLCLLFVLFNTQTVLAQSNHFSPNRIFDTLQDNLGNKYSLKDLKIDTITIDGTGGNTKVGPCNAGYFKLFYEPGSGMEQNTPLHAARRNVMCQLMVHLSSFINSPLTTTGKKVNVWVRNTSNMSLFNSNAGARTFYSGIGTGNIIDNEAWKTIQTGQDSYAGIVSPISSTGAFYHVWIAFDFTNFNWHDNLLTSAPTGTFDLYSIALHEITHALGFHSLLSYNGSPTVAWGYDRYDQFLKTQTNLPLITNSGSCSLYNYGINPSISNITNTLSPGAGTCGTLPSTVYTNSTTCGSAILYASITQTVPVYTPNCFEAASSLHHFEDMCYPSPNPTKNDQYFTMCSGIPSGVTRRYLQEEERKVLCDIGYSVNASYGSPTYTTTQKTYTAGACGGLGVAGVNDGINAGLYTLFTNLGVSTGLIFPCSNDIPNTGLNFECLQVVVGNGTLSGTSGSSFSYTPSISGVHVLKYIPYNVSTSVRGNITYIFIYVSNMSGCTPVNTCEMVTNGGFENMTGNCGAYMVPAITPTINCWGLISGISHVFTRNCTSTTFTVPNNNINTPPFETHNGPPNNNFVSLTDNAVVNAGLYQTILTTSLVPNNQYNLSFWVADHYSAGNPLNPFSSTVDFGVSPSPIVAPIPSTTNTPSSHTSIGKFNLINDKLWHYYTSVFTFTGTTQSNNLGIIAIAKTLLGPSADFLIDDISIIPINVACNFSLQPQICIGNNINNLQTLVSVPNGTFTGPGVTGSAGSYTFNSTTAGAGWQTIVYTYTTASGCKLSTNGQIFVVGAAPTVSITSVPFLVHPYCPATTFTLTANTPNASNLYTYTWSPGSYSTQIATYTPTVTGIYTVAVGDPLGCNAPVTSTVQIQIEVPAPVITPTVQYICSGQTATLYTTPINSAQNYTWMPGGSNNLTITVTPTVSTVYTLTAEGYGGCYGTATSTVYLQCCTMNTIACALTNTIVNSGSYALNQNATISGTVGLYSIELSIAPGISITVLPNSTLTINKSHFYACNEMWQGITVMPGGYLIIESDALIEDAIIAVSIPSHTSTIGPILKVNTSVFNKNYTAISVSTYTAALTVYPFEITNSIFTCRSFTSSGMSWPQVSPLKATCTVTNNLASPYCLLNFSFSNLKAPYSATSSQEGITLNYVGKTQNATGTPTYNCFTVGDYITTSNFNIFDNLFYGIRATDANLKVYNSVFQNMQSAFSFSTGYVGGIGISHNTSTLDPNTNLNLTPPSPYYSTRKNKFYDCTYGVLTSNIFEVKADYMEFRSQQTSSGSYQQGKYGMYHTTDRFRQYDVNNNQMYNIENGIVFNSTYGPVKLSGTTYTNTQYAGNVNLNYNTIKPVASGTIGSAFVSNAISAQNILSSGSTQTVLAGAIIKSHGNIINDAYRGVYGANFTNPKIWVASNNITLKTDPNTNIQYGISNVSCTSNTISTNNVTGPNTTNTLITAIYCSLNNTAAVTCNTVSTTHQAFEFAGSNPSTAWKGNSMTTHTLGLVLTNTAVIGQQGSTGNPIDNAWNGTWTGSKYHTYTSNSTPTLSSLYVQNTVSYYPSNNSSLNFGEDYTTAGTNTTTGSYSCGGGGGGSSMMGGESEESANLKVMESTALSEVDGKNGFSASNFIAQYQLYRLLDNNSTLQSASKTLGDFYTNNKTKSYGVLLNGEIDLTNANYSSATSALIGISNKNNIEYNYSDFYNFYTKYYTGSYTSNDNVSLANLANKCPFVEGEIVYKARALYNIINNTMELFKDNCPIEKNGNSRLANNKTALDAKTWNVNIYPNPANDEIFVNSNIEKEDINIVIADVSGRIVLNEIVKTNAFTANLKLSFKDGIYFVTLTNRENNKVIKKLVVTR